MTFLEIQELLQKHVRSSTTEYTEVIKGAINEAHLWAQRAHNFMLAERLESLTYTGNAASVDLPEDPVIKELTAVQDDEGLYDKLSKAQFLEWRLRYPNGLRRRLFYTTADQLVLYPTPVFDRPLTLHVNVLLPSLEGDEDTDFLTTYAWDFLVYQALLSLSVFLNEDVRLEGLSQLVEMKWLSVLEWDMRLRGDYHEAQQLAQRRARVPPTEDANIHREVG